MNRIIIALLLGCAFLTLHVSQAQDGETIARGLSTYWAGRARQHRAIKQHQDILRRRRRARRARSMPPWIKYKASNANGQKTLTLEDMKLWASIDLDKNGKLTVGEFDRFIRSPTARAFVNQMKSEKAVKQWADSVGMDVAKAKHAMSMGARAQAQRSARAQQNVFNRRRLLQQRALQQRRAQASRRNNYFANIGRQYYRAMSRGRRDEL